MENVEHGQAKIETPKKSHGWRFWCIFVALCLISFVCSLDASIIATALPTIVKQIDGQEQYIWIANSFVFASTVPQPLFAQISNIIGRRSPMIAAIVLFALGSGIAGGASTPAMLIGGRTVQGLGTGGIYVLLEVLISDLVPLRDRGKYYGLQLSAAAVGTAIAPVIGGPLAIANWRWIFYLNIPVSGVALAAMVVFLNVRYKRSPSWKHALARTDILGNAIFIPSILSILLGLVLAGVVFPWNSWHVILPLVLGFVGWAGFHVYQSSAICKEPSMPPRLFNHRTSAIGFILTFISHMVLESIAYFIPVYFQAVKGDSPLTSGVDLLPYALAIVPFGIIAGIIMSKSGLFRPLHWVGFALDAIGAGLLTLLDEKSSKAAWAGFLIIAAAGTGIVMTCVLPSILAVLPEADVAVATGTYSFIRSFGFVWGVTIPSIVFNSQFNRYSVRITSPSVRTQLVNGAGYGYVSGSYINNLAPATRHQVISVYVDTLRIIWFVTMAFSVAGFVVSLGTKHHDLRKELNTEYGLKEADGMNEEDNEIKPSIEVETDDTT